MCLIYCAHVSESQTEALHSGLNELWLRNMQAYIRKASTYLFARVDWCTGLHCICNHFLQSVTLNSSGKKAILKGQFFVQIRSV